MTDPSPQWIPTREAGDEFVAERSRLLGLAYRMLGSLADAEDVVQDVWLRWNRVDRSVVENPAAWLTTATTRASLDRIRSLARRREDYVGPWLPEPVAVATAGDPAAAAELAESMTLGFLVVLDALSATERAVFLLAEVFGEPYAAVAVAVGKTEENCRQIASRARRKVRAARPPELTSAPADVLVELLAAVAAGDIDALLHLLDTDVVMISDGGPDRRAARRPVVGSQRVSRFLINLAARVSVNGVELGSLNGESVLIVQHDDGPIVVSGDVTGSRIVALRAQRNPAKLTHLTEPTILR